MAARDDSGHRRAILEQDDERGRILRPPDRLEPAEIALRGAEFAGTPRASTSLRAERRSAAPRYGDQRRHRRLGMRDVDDALVDRDAGAEREHQHRDDEAPEVELAAVAERVVLVGRLACAARRPHISSSWLAESTTLCTPSVSMADEPVIAAATNFDTAMPRFAASAMTSVRLCVGAHGARKLHATRTRTRDAGGERSGEIVDETREGHGRPLRSRPLRIRCVRCGSRGRRRRGRFRASSRSASGAGRRSG